jgi:hypothetical protein
LFGPALERTQSFYPNGMPIQPLEVSVKATMSAVSLVFSLLLPQAVVLFNYEAIENKVHCKKIRFLGNSN